MSFELSFRRISKASVLGLAVALTVPASAQSRNPFSSQRANFTGALLGEVRNAAGVTQMGATVLLYDRYDNLVRKALSTEDGKFAFAALGPDVYTLKVTLASYFPAMRRITVLAGVESLLQVSLAAVLSSIDIAPGAPNKATLMSDEWKWVLRSSQSMRPVLRFVPLAPAKESASLFSDVTGVVKVQGGDSNLLSNGMQQDMGTAFAVETSMSGGNKVRVSGNLGYGASSGLPSAGFRTTYTRDRQGAAGPQVSLTVRQAYFPAPIGGNQNAPVLRTASFSTIDALEIMEGLKLEYGSSLDSVMLYGRMAYISPFARATYNLGNGGVFKVAFSSGFAPTDLIARQPEGQTDLNQDLMALAQAPRISRRDDHAAVERTKNYEASYQVVDRKRTFTMTAFRENVANAVFLMSGDITMAGAANLLPDLNTRGTVFNAGDYQRSGFSASLTEAVTDRIEISVEGGQAGALVAEANSGRGPLRSNIQTSPRPWVSAYVHASMPVTGTRLAASYGWTDFRALMPTHQSLTGRTNQQVGWNFSGRQPLPCFFGMRMEVTAELRNLLAQGYLGLNGPDGQRGVLTNVPRQVRGGVSFIF
jgi:hypothetical protein